MEREEEESSQEYLQQDILPQYFDQHYIETLAKSGPEQLKQTEKNLIKIQKTFATYWAGQSSAYDCIKVNNALVNQLLTDSSRIAGSRGGPNIHIFFKLLSQLIPQYRLVFKREFKLTEPKDLLNDLKSEIKSNDNTANQSILTQLDKLYHLKSQNSDELIELIWESWQLAKFIDVESQNLNRQNELKDKIHNSELYGINLNQGWGDAKRSRIFLYIYMVLLEDGLKVLNSLGTGRM
jgi:hypothetical protein